MLRYPPKAPDPAPGAFVLSMAMNTVKSTIVPWPDLAE
jgi:hypothetical protein